MNRTSNPKQRASFLLLVAAAGFSAYWLIRRQRYRQTKELPGMSSWWKLLVEQHGEVKARKLRGVFEEDYAALLNQTALPAHPALQRHLKEHILPGLAIYQVLLNEYDGDREAALAEIDVLFRVWTADRCKGLTAAMKILPMPFWLFKMATRVQMRSFPSQGWDFHPVELSNTQLAFNATRCFYLDTLILLGAPELTASFCKTDEVMAEAFPATIRFVRPHTLGRGDSLCDFKYCYQAKPPYR